MVIRDTVSPWSACNSSSEASFSSRTCSPSSSSSWASATWAEYTRSKQWNNTSQSSSTRNRRVHGVCPWLVLLDFLTWLTLEIADEVVHNPSSSEYVHRLDVYPQLIKQIVNSIRGFHVLYFFTLIEGSCFQSLQQFTSPSFWGHSCIAHKETNPPYCLKSAPSNVGVTSPRPSPYCRGSFIARDVDGRIPLWQILV